MFDLLLDFNPTDAESLEESKEDIEALLQLIMKSQIQKKMKIPSKEQRDSFFNHHFPL
jgi:predicted RNase H-like HicB family nuclease